MVDDLFADPPPGIPEHDAESFAAAPPVQAVPPAAAPAPTPAPAPAPAPTAASEAALATPTAPEASPSAVDVLRLIADRLASLEHLVAGMAGVDPTPDAHLVSALAERNDQLSEAMLRHVDERLSSLAESLANVSVGASPSVPSSITSRLDAIDRRITALEAFAGTTPSWLPELFAAVAESKGPVAATAAAPAWVGQLAQDLRSLRSSLARLVG